MSFPDPTPASSLRSGIRSRHFLITVFVVGVGLGVPELLAIRLPSAFYGQFERCPTSSRDHLQAVYTHPTTATISAARAAIDKSLTGSCPGIFAPCHVELLATGGDVERSIAYCSKLDSRLTLPTGEPPRVIKRPASRAPRPTVDLVALAKAGKSVKTILSENVSLWRSVTAIVACVKIFSPPPPIRRDIVSIFISGRSGLGKTHSTSKLPNIIRMTAQAPYLHNYTGVSEPHTLIFDDLTPPSSDSDPLFTAILELADPFVSQRRILHGSCYPTHTHFAITSQYSIHEFLAGIKHQDRQCAFVRRFHYVVELVSPLEQRFTVAELHTGGGFTFVPVVPPAWLTDLFVRDDTFPPSLDHNIPDTQLFP